ncbi:hypothetical protein CR205_01160 [Alteribacter lacisalsi]|uniref:Tail specific protease domain-containing protein n=1 Tax=Alteribacter lacisalsi TaxID=2045244 RepID=A0A2W0H5X1_9BACI|nr:S41 family peptidase [Alteribacter lacisalsi]PYZ97243.1 hypothetical protein CR205_01160 [Alteribacter lacisalsi]
MKKKALTTSVALMVLAACSGQEQEVTEEVTDAVTENKAVSEPVLGDILTLAMENRKGDPADNFDVDDYLYDYTAAESEELSEEELKGLRLSGESPAEAEAGRLIEDTHTLHRALKYQYALYEANGGDEAFEEARNRVINELESTYENDEIVSPRDFEEILHNHYSFIRDTHFYINGSLVTPMEHRLFINDETAFYKQKDGSFIHRENGELLESVNGNEEVDAYLLPSLSDEGSYVYVPGIFSDTEPNRELELVTGGEKEQVRLYQLSASYSGGESEINFESDVPIFSLKDFFFYENSDVTSEGLLEESRELENEPYWILDLRSNPGGYPDFADEWHRQHFGISPGFGDYVMQLYSNTGHMVFQETEEYYRELGVVEDPIWSEVGSYHGMIMPLEEPRWSRFYSAYRRAENEDSVIFVVTDHYTASAAEYMTQVMKHVENTVIVGTNTAGALNSGGALMWELPHSNVKMDVPAAFSYHPENLAQEGIGLEPDLWVDPHHAVERIEALVKKEQARED